MRVISKNELPDTSVRGRITQHKEFYDELLSNIRSLNNGEAIEVLDEEIPLKNSSVIRSYIQRRKDSLPPVRVISRNKNLYVIRKPRGKE